MLITHMIMFRELRERNHVAKVKTALKEGRRDSKRLQFKAPRINRGDDHGHAEDIMETAE